MGFTLKIMASLRPKYFVVYLDILKKFYFEYWFIRLRPQKLIVSTKSTYFRRLFSTRSFKRSRLMKRSVNLRGHVRFSVPWPTIGKPQAHMKEDYSINHRAHSFFVVVCWWQKISSCSFKGPPVSWCSIPIKTPSVINYFTSISCHVTVDFERVSVFRRVDPVLPVPHRGSTLPDVLARFTRLCWILTKNLWNNIIIILLYNC